MFGKNDNGAPEGQPQERLTGMKKADLDMVMVKLMVHGEEALWIKVYRDGTVVRNGAGGVPSVEVGAMVQFPDAQLWQAVMARLPEQALHYNEVFRAQEIRTPIAYTLAFYGDSSNGETGEQAKWTRSQGIHIETDLNATPYPPLLPLVDQVGSLMTALTNDWYFDVVVFACLDMKASQLPDGFISQPKTDAGKQESWKQFLTQVLQGPSKGDLSRYPDGKVYLDQRGISHRMTLSVEGWSVNYHFHPL